MFVRVSVALTICTKFDPLVYKRGAEVSKPAANVHSFFQDALFFMVNRSTNEFEDFGPFIIPFLV